MNIPEKPDDFKGPITLPKDSLQAKKWQKAICSWWQKHPLRYDWRKEIGYPEFSPQFYAELDRRFFSDVKIYLPWKKVPFDALIDFGALRNKDVLEIGVGLGSVASLLAQYARTFTGIDITDYAVKGTQERMRILGLEARVLQMDAENLEFADNTFDFIWAWGVVHHASDTCNVFQQMRRVLKPQGRALLMVYRRGFWNYYVIGILQAIFRGGFFRMGPLHKIMQNATDGALARFYSLSEWKALASRYFYIEKILVLGRKSDIILLPAGKLKDFVCKITPDSLVRFWLNHCRMGGLIVSILRRNS